MLALLLLLAAMMVEMTSSSSLPIGAIVLAGLTLGACGGQGRDRNHDVTRAVAASTAGTPVLSMFWRQPISDSSRDPSPQEFASPAFRLTGSRTEDMLYLGSHSGWFYALMASTGEIVWKRNIGSVSSRALLHRGRIYVGTDDGFMICLNNLGEEIWRYATQSPILEEAIVSGDSLIISNEGDQVYALDLESGKFRWLYKTDSDTEFTLRGHSGVAADPEGELVYVGLSDGSVVALRSATGSVAWVSSLRGTAERFVDVDTTPVIAGDLVLAASSAGGLFAMNKTTGRIQWQRDVSGGGGLLATDDRIYFVAAEMGLYAMDLDGNVLWRQGTRGGGESARPILHRGYLFFNLSEDGLFVADTQTGEVVQYFDPGSGVSAPPTLGRGNMYVMSNGAVLYSLGVNEG
jgi:outer membrane protein assembly factor BamB